MNKSRRTNDEKKVDDQIGSQIRFRRTVLGLSQEALGKEIGISYQQVQKYETSDNRVSASRLHNIAKILGVQLDYFFDEEAVDDVARLELELIRNLHLVPKKQQFGIAHLVRAMAKQDAGDEKTDP